MRATPARIINVGHAERDTTGRLAVKHWEFAPGWDGPILDDGDRVCGWEADELILIAQAHRLWGPQVGQALADAAWSALTN